MRIKVVFASLLVLLLLSAFVPQPAPLFAIALPEGRTLDEGHDSGYIDWSGGVSYVNLNHRDGLCPSNCVEQVTRIFNGGTASGAFAAVDVAYFEVMVAFTHNSGAGTAVLNACGSSAAWYLYVGPGSGLPGFVSMSVPVPAGCTSWSLSASGGYVDFRSVDANYVSPPPPVATNTFTPIPTETFSPTGTMTPTPIATETLTPTATETLLPGVTPSNTPTLTDTPSPTLTSAPSQTLPPGVTPSDTPIPTNTPILPVATNTPKPPPSSSGQGGNPTVIPFVAFPTATQTRSVAVVVPTTIVIQTVTSVPASTATPRPIVTLPAGELACTSSTGSDFPWWLLPAGLTLASAFSLLGTLVKNLNLDTASLQAGDFSISPFGVTLRVPRLVPRVTTVGEWVTRLVRTLVQITRTIFRTIVEAIPRFITVTRQVVDRVVRSEWITTFRQVAKTFWETVIEKVPLLGFLGKVIGFIWKTVVKPIVRWVTEAIRTLRTWVENVARWVVERIQDGWNYLTRQIAETVREWVEKTEWVREFVSRQITVWETVWEKKFFAFSIPLGGGGGKLAMPAQQTWSKVLRTLGTGTALATLATMANFCVNPFSPSCTPTPAPDVTMTNAVGTQFANFMTQTAMAFTPTPISTATPSVTDNLNSNYSGLEHLNGWIQQNQAWLIANGYPTDAQYWQNYYNQQIIETANKYGISPALLKGLILRESNNAVTPIIFVNGQPRLNYQAGGLVQLTGAGADTIFRYKNVPLADYYYNLAYKYAVQGGLLFPSVDDKTPLYIELNLDQKLIIQDVVKQMFDGQCVQWEVTAGHCTAEQMTTPLLNDGKDNITLGAINLTATQQDIINYVGQANWASLPPAEQQKLIIATYKGGIGCIGNAIQNAQSANGGQIQNWNQVAQNLSGDCKGETELYVNSVLCYASNMSETQANSCASPNP